MTVRNIREAGLDTPDNHSSSQLIADEMARLDSVQGNIPALAGRLASVRTWAYIANRADWLIDPAHWAARTTEVEERLSDALHRQLTERFVDKRTSQLLRSRGTDVLPGDFQVDDAGQVSMFDEPVGTLAGFRFRPENAVRSGDRKRFLAATEAAPRHSHVIRTPRPPSRGARRRASGRWPHRSDRSARPRRDRARRWRLHGSVRGAP